MTKRAKKGIRRVTWPAAPRMQRPTILASMGALAGAAFVSLCLLHDVRLAGGYDFLARTFEAKVLSRLIGAAGVGLAYVLLTKVIRYPLILPGVLLFESLVLAIHVPIVFGSNGPGWLFVVGLAITAPAFLVAAGKRVQDDLRRIGAADVPVQPPHHPK
jgi:hypothetical protein